MAREWWERLAATWAESHSAKILSRVERDVFPWIGQRPIREVKPPELLAVLRRIEERGAVETAHRAHQNCGQVFRYAVATGRLERDPSADLRGALPPSVPTNHAALTDPQEIGGLLRVINAYQGTLTARCALRLSPLVFVRPGELRGAEWAEFDLDASKWNIPAERMKMKQPHLVPLSTQAVAILRELHPFTGTGRFVFPSPRSTKRPMSNNTIRAALRRMGYENEDMTAHGFRAMARIVLDEVLGVGIGTLVFSKPATPENKGFRR